MLLSYQQGFRKTTLADIAEKAGVPLGNVYYYFKTKDEIAHAIIDERLSQFYALRAKLESMASPKDRLLAFAQMTMNNRQQLAKGGCEMGTLCSELQKEPGELAIEAGRLLSEPLGWLTAQFRALGKAPAEGLALHLLSALQGVSVLANALHDPAVVAAETAYLKAWIEEL